MTLSPKQLLELLDEEDKKVLQRLEMHIDNELRKRYVGGEITIWWEATSVRVQKRIKEMYAKAGWSVMIQNQHDQHDGSSTHIRLREAQPYD